MPCTINPIKINAVNKGTASACNDYRPPEDERCREQINDEPHPCRALVRLLVVLAVAAMTVWAVVYIANSNKKGSVQVKKVKGEPLKVAKENFPPLPPGSIIKADPQATPNLTCPCDTSPATYSWCKFIDFSLIVCNKETNYKPEVTWISTTKDSCTRPQNLDPLCQYFNKTLRPACINAVNTALDFVLSSEMPHIQTPTLSTSLDVHDHVAQQMQANIYTQNQTIQNRNSNKNSTQDVDVLFDPATSYDDAMLALVLLQSMVVQVFDCKTNSTPQEFWDRGMTCGWNMYPEIGKRMDETKFVFGMSVDYDTYSTECKPSYCYIFQEEGLTRRFMHAFAEVGGSFNLILVGIQFILWPLVAIILRFPHAPSLDPIKLITPTTQVVGPAVSS